MNNFLPPRIILASVLLLTLTTACGTGQSGHVQATLDDIGTYINERPDSALTVLRGIDSTGLKTRSMRARYSLLHVMALYKNYEDITVPGLLDDAIDYYPRRGTADEKLKTYYYQGCIYQEKKDLSAAAISYSLAEGFAEQARDRHTTALLYEAFSSVYNSVYNTRKEQEYVEKALEALKEAGDPMYDSFKGDLAQVYHTRKEWQKADSLYCQAIAGSEAYPAALSNYLSNYARMKLLQPDEDPDGAIELLDRKSRMSGKGLTPKEAGAYAYALALTGKKPASQSLKTRLEALTGQERYNVLPWLARIAVLDGDFSTAYILQAEMHTLEESLILNTMTDSVTQSLNDHAELSLLQEKGKKIRIALLSLIVVISLLSLVILLVSSNRKAQAELDRVMNIQSSLEKDLLSMQQQSEAHASGLSQKLQHLSGELLQERLDRFRERGEYSYLLWMEQNNRLSKLEVIRSFRKELREICTLERDIRMLKKRMDDELDGLVSRLQADLMLKDGSIEMRLLCYWLVDLKPDMIAELTGLTLNNIYVREHRLKEKIKKLEKPEYAFLL